MFPIFIIGLFTGVFVSIIYYKYKADTPSEVKLKMQEADIIRKQYEIDELLKENEKLNKEILKKERGNK